MRQYPFSTHTTIPTTTNLRAGAIIYNITLNSQSNMVDGDHPVPPATDTYKQIAAGPLGPPTIERNEQDCTLQVNHNDCTLEPSDRDCTLEVNRRVEDSNKERAGPTTSGQTEADESGQGQLATESSKARRRKRIWVISFAAVFAVIVVLIVIITPIVTFV